MKNRKIHSHKDAVCRVVIGTHNRDKLRELKRLLDGSGIEVLSLDDAGRRIQEAVEDGRTYEANARKKASFYAKQTGLLTLADDSGLSVASLRGRPGVYSARFAGSGCTYQDNNQKLLRLLSKKPPRSRKAKFICVMALYDGRGAVGVSRGECPGMIADQICGENGFGYDPIFIPTGFKKTFAQLSARTKNRISHRGKALRAVRRIILRYFR